MPKVRRRRKRLFIDQHRIDRVKALLHVGTATEAIDRALVEELALFEAEVDRGLTGLVGRGGVIARFSGIRASSMSNLYLMDANVS